MRFTKMQGCGNDYVYVDCFANPPPRDPAALSRAVSDRHFGVGSDGLILICPSEKADARMRMFNADGSESEMCGNGIRCVAKFVHDHGIAKKPTLKIETGNGVLSLNLEVKNGKAERVRVDMGEPILEAAKVPVQIADANGTPLPQVIDLRYGVAMVEVDDDESEETTESAEIEESLTCVSMGNPHAVFFCRNVELVPLTDVGPLLERHDMFPRR